MSDYSNTVQVAAVTAVVAAVTVDVVADEAAVVVAFVLLLFCCIDAVEAKGSWHKKCFGWAFGAQDQFPLPW